MSNATIARWNAIPLNRPEEADSSLAKRSRPPSENDDDDDDDISLVSRSPSPPPDRESKAGRSGTEWYDEHVKGVAREVVTVETKIKPTNVGFNLLKKMGWKEGEGLGMSGEGRPEPIPFSLKNDTTGLGKTSQDFRVIESTVAQRRELDSERQIKETEEQRKARENLVAQKEAIKSEVTAVLRPFYCELCDKQYSNVSQFDEHVRGYAHTHKLRFQEMSANQRPKDTEKRKEKERKREEKELKKLAAAHGIKLPAATHLAPVAVAPVLAGGTSQEPKKGGWGVVGSSATKTGGGWATVGSTPAPPSTVKSSSGWATVSSASSSPPLVSTMPTSPTSNTFKSGGWTRLDTTADPSTASQPPAAPSRGGWASVPASSSSSAPPQQTSAPSFRVSGFSTSSFTNTTPTEPTGGFAARKGWSPVTKDEPMPPAPTERPPSPPQDAPPPPSYPPARRPSPPSHSLPQNNHSLPPRTSYYEGDLRDPPRSNDDRRREYDRGYEGGSREDRDYYSRDSRGSYGNRPSREQDDRQRYRNDRDVEMRDSRDSRSSSPYTGQPRGYNNRGGTWNQGGGGRYGSNSRY